MDDESVKLLSTVCRLIRVITTVRPESLQNFIKNQGVAVFQELFSQLDTSNPQKTKRIYSRMDTAILQKDTRFYPLLYHVVSILKDCVENVKLSNRLSDYQLITHRLIYYLSLDFLPVQLLSVILEYLLALSKYSELRGMITSSPIHILLTTLPLLFKYRPEVDEKIDENDYSSYQAWMTSRTSPCSLDRVGR